MQKFNASTPVRHGLAARIVGRPLFWIAFVGVLFGVPLVRGLRNPKGPPPPPVMGAFPAFALRDDRAEPFGTEQLAGHAFIANLLCVHCPVEGALAAEQMRTLQHRARNLGDALLLVSFSPDGDSAALTAIRKQKPSSHRWTLLAGAPEQVRALFPGQKGLVLVDARFRIRGRYEPSEIDRALRDASLMLDDSK